MVPSQAPYIAHVNAFNSGVRRMIGDLSRRRPNDPVVHRVAQRVRLAIDTLPITVIDLVGYYLYQYREQVYAGNDAFFVNNTYDDDIRAAVDQERVDLTMLMIPKVKDTWATLDAGEKQQLRELVCRILDEYIDYRLLTAGGQA
jgi:hypothetical protein